MAFYKEVFVFNPQALTYDHWIAQGFNGDIGVDAIEVTRNSVIVTVDQTNPDSVRTYIDCPAVISQVEI